MRVYHHLLIFLLLFLNLIFGVYSNDEASLTDQIEPQSMDLAENDELQHSESCPVAALCRRQHHGIKEGDEFEIKMKCNCKPGDEGCKDVPCNCRMTFGSDKPSIESKELKIKDRIEVNKEVIETPISRRKVKKPLKLKSDSLIKTYLEKVSKRIQEISEKIPPQLDSPKIEIEEKKILDFIENEEKEISRPLPLTGKRLPSRLTPRPRLPPRPRLTPLPRFSPRPRLTPKKLKSKQSKISRKDKLILREIKSLIIKLVGRATYEKHSDKPFDLLRKIILKELRATKKLVENLNTQQLKNKYLELYNLLEFVKKSRNELESNLNGEIHDVKNSHDVIRQNRNIPSASNKIEIKEKSDNFLKLQGNENVEDDIKEIEEVTKDVDITAIESEIANDGIDANETSEAISDFEVNEENINLKESAIDNVNIGNGTETETDVIAEIEHETVIDNNDTEMHENEREIDADIDAQNDTDLKEDEYKTKIISYNHNVGNEYETDNNNDDMNLDDNKTFEDLNEKELEAEIDYEKEGTDQADETYPSAEPNWNNTMLDVSDNNSTSISEFKSAEIATTIPDSPISKEMLDEAKDDFFANIIKTRRSIHIQPFVHDGPLESKLSQDLLFNGQVQHI